MFSKVPPQFLAKDLANAVVSKSPNNLLEEND